MGYRSSYQLGKNTGKGATSCATCGVAMFLVFLMPMFGLAAVVISALV